MLVNVEIEIDDSGLAEVQGPPVSKLSSAEYDRRKVLLLLKKTFGIDQERDDAAYKILYENVTDVNLI